MSILTPEHALQPYLSKIHLNVILPSTSMSSSFQDRNPCVHFSAFANLNKSSEQMLRHCGYWSSFQRSLIDVTACTENRLRVRRSKSCRRRHFWIWKAIFVTVFIDLKHPEYILLVIVTIAPWLIWYLNQNFAVIICSVEFLTIVTWWEKKNCNVSCSLLLVEDIFIRIFEAIRSVVKFIGHAFFRSLWQACTWPCNVIHNLSVCSLVPHYRAV